jgi:hypothetical protein
VENSQTVRYTSVSNIRTVGIFQWKHSNGRDIPVETVQRVGILSVSNIQSVEIFHYKILNQYG